jgi:2'-5' RNA ligase
VIWAGTEKGKIESEGIAKTLEERLETAGFEREERPFKAHLTIGRVRSPKNKGPLKERLLAATIDKPLSQKVDSVILFKSELKPAGPVYTKVHESKLT